MRQIVTKVIQLNRDKKWEKGKSNLKRENIKKESESDNELEKVTAGPYSFIIYF